MDPPVLSDPMARKIGSGLPDPSGLDSNHADPKDANTKSSGPKDSEMNKSSADKVRPQQLRPATLDIVKGTADASMPKPRPEFIDPKHATLRPIDPQDVKSQALDTYGKSGKAQGSSSEVPRPDDPKADSTSTDRYQMNDPADSSSNVDDLSFQQAKDLTPQEYKSHPPGPDTKDFSSLGLQDVKTASSAAVTPDSLSDQSKFTEEHAAISQPHESPAADHESSDDNNSNAEDTHEEINIFHILPAELFNLIKAPSPSAKPSDGKHLTPGDSEPDPPSQPKFSKSPQSQSDPSDGTNTPKGDVLAIEFSDEDVPAQRSSAKTDLYSMTASANGSSLMPHKLASDRPSASSDNTEGSFSRTAPADPPASVPVAASTSEIPGSASSPASTAFTSRRLSGGEPNNNRSSEKQSDSIQEKKGSGTALLASKKHLERSSTLSSATELLYRTCLYMLPWLLMSL